MKFLQVILAFVGVTLVALMLTQCEGNKGEATGRKFDQEREEVKEELRSLRRDIDREIDELGTKIDNASDDGKAKMEDARRALNEEKQELDKALDKVDVKKGARKTADDVRQGFRELGQKFQELFDDKK
jgi:hypothetical protein